MRTLFTAFALALLLAPCRADVFDEEDGKESKKGDPKHTGTGEGETRRERQLWEAYVKKLGDGPIYRVEVLFRGPGDDHLTYCRHYVSAAIPMPRGLFGFGVNAKGEVMPPTNPGREPVKAALEARKVGKNDEPPPPPLATRTRYLGVSLDRKDIKPGTAVLHVSDVATNLPLPKKPGEPESIFFDRALFRLELVTTEDVRKAGPLRQDTRLFRDRINSLRTEHLPDRDLMLSPGKRRHLVNAANLFRDLELLTAVRKMLDDWIAHPPFDNDGPGYVVSCLAALGDERDFAAFHRLAKRRPEHAADLTWPTLKLVERVGAAKAMPLVEDLLKNTVRRGEDGRIEVLRELDPTIPEQTDGDRFLEQAVRHFRLKATCYELCPVQQTLEALQKTRPLTPEQQLKLATCHESEYVFLTKAARRRGVELVLDWFKQYQPPANK